MPKPSYLNSDDETILLKEIRELKINHDPSQEIVKISKQSSNLPLSILIVNGDWYILSPNRYPNHSPVREDCWNYKIQFPEDETALPTISEEPYLIKKTMIKTDSDKLSLNSQVASLGAELEATRAYIDSNVSEVWRNSKTNTACKPSKNAIHYCVMQLPKIVSLSDYFNSSERLEKGFALLNWFNVALSTIKQIEKVHNNNQILGKLENTSVYYIEETQEVFLMDYSQSVSFDTPLRNSEDENKTCALAAQSSDVYALGDANSPLTDLIKNAPYHKDEPLEEKRFRQGIETCYMTHFLRANVERPSLKEAKTVLIHLQEAYQGIVERKRFLDIAVAFDKINAKVSLLAQKPAPSETEADVALRKEKIKALTKFQADVANKVMRCYLEKPGTKEFFKELNKLCDYLQSHDWSKDEATAKLYNRRSSSGLYADIVLGGLLIGLIPMLIKALNAAWQGKSFIQNFCLFSEIGSVTVLENFARDMPRLTEPG